MTVVQYLPYVVVAAIAFAAGAFTVGITELLRDRREQRLYRGRLAPYSGAYGSGKSQGWHRS